MSLYEEQYRRSQKVRVENKRQERLLHHEIESRRGLNDIQRYRMEMFNRQQKEVSRELDRIRVGIKRNLSLAPDFSGKGNKSDERVQNIQRSNQFQNQWKSSSKNRSRKSSSMSNYCGQEESNRSEICDENAIHELQTLAKTSDSDEQKNENHSESDYNSNIDEEESIPDIEVLKAIMNGLVSDWEQNVMQTIEKREKSKNIHQQIASNLSNSKRGDYCGENGIEDKQHNASSEYSKFTETSSLRTASDYYHTDQDRKKRYSGASSRADFNDHANRPLKRRHLRSSGKPTNAKDKASKFYDAQQQEGNKFQSKRQNQFTQQTRLYPNMTVASHEKGAESRAINQNHAAGLYDQTHTTNYQNELCTRKAEPRKNAEVQMGSQHLKDKQQTLNDSFDNETNTGTSSTIPTMCTLPRLRLVTSSQYSARENSSKPTHSNFTLSSRSDGYRSNTKQSFESSVETEIIPNKKNHKNITSSPKPPRYLTSGQKQGRTGSRTCLSSVTNVISERINPQDQEGIRMNTEDDRSTPMTQNQNNIIADHDDNTPRIYQKSKLHILKGKK